MKKVVWVVVVVCLLLSACYMTSWQNDALADDSGRAVNAAHTSENSLSWAGIYTGTTPGANSDIKIILTLTYDLRYTMTYQYVDKSKDVYTDTGGFKWNSAGNTITLSGTDMPKQYRVGEGKLTQLDINGQVITENPDHYVLKQIIQE
ncbi:MAG: copper resistance protein NlpE [Synergistaceae bacterium]|jgi:uncharacterized lipoprotein NlpE involved in copper resistance|nr:copper resistance protein NlpE [Synergistaceae bacterium]